jgi:hypothetical protein
MAHCPTLYIYTYYTYTYDVYILQLKFRINYIENSTWVRGNTRFISSVEHDISRVSAENEWDTFNTRNKSGISKHPC